MVDEKDMSEMTCKGEGNERKHVLHAYIDMYIHILCIQYGVIY